MQKGVAFSINTSSLIEWVRPNSPKGRFRMRKYETLVVLRPDLEEESRVALIEKFKEIIAAEGEVTNVDEWGTKKLAYEIEKLREGYYIIFEYNAETTLPKEFERNLKISEDVLRFMTVNKE